MCVCWRFREVCALGRPTQTLLRAAIELAPANVEIMLYDKLAEIPHFNPDLDTETPPRAVSEFRGQLQNADGVLICSPEYAARRGRRFEKCARLDCRQRRTDAQTGRITQCIFCFHTRSRFAQRNVVCDDGTTRSANLDSCAAAQQ